MVTKINTWVEKIKKKKVKETAPAYDKAVFKDDFSYQTRKPDKRATPCLKMTMNRSLRGIRKGGSI